MQRAGLHNKQATNKVEGLVGAELDVDGPSRCEVDGTVGSANQAATVLHTTSKPYRGYRGIYQLVRNESAKRQTCRFLNNFYLSLDRTPN